MTKLSININKIALIRNSRGGNMPDLIKVALDCERFGAEGITIHPRPDERHARYQDMYDLKSVLHTELNVEGNPNARFIQVVCDAKPAQVTLVPDAADAITSNAGWDTLHHASFLTEIVSEFKKQGIRVSIFVDPNGSMIEGAKKCGADRVELYTEAYASHFHDNKEDAVSSYYKAALVAKECQLGLNAGHDLNLHNLSYLQQTLPALLEVSIGHALVCDALYLGLENAIQLYLRELTK